MRDKKLATCTEVGCTLYSGLEKRLSRLAHNQKEVGSTPTFATTGSTYMCIASFLLNAKNKFIYFFIYQPLYPRNRVHFYCYKNITNYIMMQKSDKNY